MFWKKLILTDIYKDFFIKDDTLHKIIKYHQNFAELINPDIPFPYT